jgi:hypothetical protein
MWLLIFAQWRWLMLWQQLPLTPRSQHCSQLVSAKAGQNVS